MEILVELGKCIERGKVNVNSVYPPDLNGKDGAVELTQKALEKGMPAQQILNEGMMPGMNRVGVKFREGKIFVPDVLIAAKAMNAAMVLLKPYFISGQLKHKGTMVIGTVSGDLHDIGKNIVKMVIEGGGWKVVDVGVDANPEKFLNAIKQNEAKAVGLSALLTTTMQNMKSTVAQIKTELPDVKVLIGGAPVTKAFANAIGADHYSRDPQGALDFINRECTV